DVSGEIRSAGIGGGGGRPHPGGRRIRGAGGGNRPRRDGVYRYALTGQGRDHRAERRGDGAPHPRPGQKRRRPDRFGVARPSDPGRHPDPLAGAGSLRLLPRPPRTFVLSGEKVHRGGREDDGTVPGRRDAPHRVPPLGKRRVRRWRGSPRSGGFSRTPTPWGSSTTATTSSGSKRGVSSS